MDTRFKSARAQEIAPAPLIKSRSIDSNSHTLAFSRRMRPSFARERSRPNKRARGTPGARCARSLACECETEHTSVVTAVLPVSAGVPHAAAFAGLLRERGPRRTVHAWDHRCGGLPTRRRPSVRGDDGGPASWRKAMRRDLAVWAIIAAAWPSASSRREVALAAIRNIERRGVATASRPAYRDDGEPPLSLRRDNYIPIGILSRKISLELEALPRIRSRTPLNLTVAAVAAQAPVRGLVLVRAHCCYLHRTADGLDSCRGY